MADRDRAMATDHRMSDIEATMWNLEKDPHLSSSFANLTVLDRPPDLARLRNRLERASVLIPRLRQRVVPGLGRLAPPERRTDPDFDLEYHVRRLALPSPASDRDLFDLAARLAQDPFERTRPLWDFVIIEGLREGRAALFQKMHHTITDGEGGVRMSEKFIDLTRDAEDPAPVEVDVEPEPPTGRALVETAAETIGHVARRQLGIARRGAEAAVGLARNPGALASLGSEAIATVESIRRQLIISDPARSPLWDRRTLRRHFDVLSVPLDDAKRTAKALGGKVNDFFVTGAAAGAGAYHRQMGTPIDELRMTMPISTRTDGSAGGNAFAPSRVLVPTGDIDPVARFEDVRGRLAVTKSERALGIAGALAGVMNLLPTSTLVRFARQQVETVDFTTSNVRGGPIDLYIAGALIEANYPMGPIAGTAFNLTLLSYRGSLDMGLHSDAGAIEDPAGLRACMEEAFAELVAAGR